MNRTHLSNYAKVLCVRGANVQRGQEVLVLTETPGLELAQLVLEEAYAAGAKCVTILLGNPKGDVTQMTTGRHPFFVSPVRAFALNHLVSCGGAVISLRGEEDPKLMEGVKPAISARYQIELKKALEAFYEDGVGKGKVHWTIGAVATTAWATRVYPELTPKKALKQLWKDIFFCARADRKSPLKAWDEHDRLMHKRANKLNEMKIKRLHFLGNGTDLWVHLSNRARFVGGSIRSAKGKSFLPNIPTEENFSAPDARLTNGKVRVVCPVLVNGRLVEGLSITFRNGRVASFTAKKNRATFAAFLKSAKGATRLGEVALVGSDSLVAKTRRFFGVILFDENRACHIALGSAYPNCVNGGTTLSSAEKRKLGFNESRVHTDFMISDDSTTVIAETATREIVLIRRGKWMI